MEIKRSNVDFNEEAHTYTLYGLPLSGITGRLGKSIFFKDKYSKIPKAILQKKAKFGSNVHKQLELYDRGLPYDNIPEVENYIKMKDTYGIQTLDVEFIVSDEQTYATPIDMLDTEFSLYDHKTTAKLDKEYVSWQLSICGYLFKMQTGITPKDYFVIHYTKIGCVVVKVDKKTDEDVFDMLYTDKYMPNDLPEMYPSVSTAKVFSDSEISKAIEIETLILNIEASLKQAKKDKDDMIAILEEKMVERGLYTAETEHLVISRTAGYTKRLFDKELFLSENPQFNGKYEKVTNVKGSIKIKIK